MALLSNSTSISYAEVLLAKRLHILQSGTICNDQKAVRSRAIDDKEMPVMSKTVQVTGFRHSNIRIPVSPTLTHDAENPNG